MAYKLVVTIMVTDENGIPVDNQGLTPYSPSHGDFLAQSVHFPDMVHPFDGERRLKCIAMTLNAMKEFV